jgi:hypothetical protein
MSDDGSDVEDFRYGYWQSWGSVTFSVRIRMPIRILRFVPLNNGSGRPKYGSGCGFVTLVMYIILQR